MADPSKNNLPHPIGTSIIDAFDLKISEGRVNTSWGTKSPLGLYLSVKRLSKETSDLGDFGWVVKDFLFLRDNHKTGRIKTSFGSKTAFGAGEVVRNLLVGSHA